jgi:hypothetical protein
MMALALADNAFENGFASLAQIYKLVVPGSTDRIRLKWDKEWAERPIFRDVEKTPGDVARISEMQPIFQDAKDYTHDPLFDDARRKPPAGRGCTRHQSRRPQGAQKRTPGGKVRISKTKSLGYQKHRHNSVRLGRTCGYRKKLQWYDWRRASGKKLNGTPPAVRPYSRRPTPIYLMR